VVFSKPALGRRLGVELTGSKEMESIRASPACKDAVPWKPKRAVRNPMPTWHKNPLARDETEIVMGHWTHEIPVYSLALGKRKELQA
jgi:hypothetical protein